MARCTVTSNLEVHHKRRNGGNGLENAEVLCQKCHANTSTYGQPGDTPPPFPEETKKWALIRAGYRCECTRECWHHLW
jgi:5-methylcytosine-specific restriction endonuclease McrA